MKIAVGFDHGGFPLKQTVLDTVRAAGHEPIDMGTNSAESVDFPDFTEKVGRAIQNGEAERGIIVCGSGVGACMAANKMKGIYASICHDTYSAAQGVMHDDMNVLCLGARVVGVELAVVSEYQGNKAGGDRLARRVGKIHKLEEGTN
jgi:ribose 5-phosphate isomerase B